MAAPLRAVTLGHTGRGEREKTHRRRRARIFENRPRSTSTASDSSWTAAIRKLPQRRAAVGCCAPTPENNIQSAYAAASWLRRRSATVLRVAWACSLGRSRRAESRECCCCLSTRCATAASAVCAWARCSCWRRVWVVVRLLAFGTVHVMVLGRSLETLRVAGRCRGPRNGKLPTASARPL